MAVRAVLETFENRALPGRSRLRDVIAALTCWIVAMSVGLMSFGFLVDEDPSPPSDPWLGTDLRLGALACLAMLARHRWPVVLALALLAVSFLSAAAAGAAVVAVYTVATDRRAAVALAITAGFVVGSPGFHLARARSDLHYFDGPILAFSLLLVAAALLGMFIRTRRQLMWSLWERAERAEAEQQRTIVHAQRLERTRIAREMHDVLAHRLSLVSMHAGALEFRAETPPELVAQAAGVVRENARQALEDLREVIGVLRDGDEQGDDVEGPQPVLADLPALVEESRAAGLEVHADLRLGDADEATVPVVAGRTAYRIVQEGLTNVRKHAPGGVVSLVVDGARGEAITVDLRNQAGNPGEAGAGLGAAGDGSAIPGGGMGLVGLAERAQLVGGRLEHGRTGDGGFRLFAWLPWGT